MLSIIRQRGIYDRANSDPIARRGRYEPFHRKGHLNEAKSKMPRSGFRLLRQPTHNSSSALLRKHGRSGAYR